MSIFEIGSSFPLLKSREKLHQQDLIWNKIMATLKPELAETVCPNSSTFVNTRDGLECNIRNAKGDMLGNCYSENNRMNGRRWTIKWHNP